MAMFFLPEGRLFFPNLKSRVWVFQNEGLLDVYLPGCVFLVIFYLVHSGKSKPTSWDPSLRVKIDEHHEQVATKTPLKNWKP